MLAKKLGMRRIIIPPHASVLSALGMLAANVIKDYSVTVMLPGETRIEFIEAAFAPLVERGMVEIFDEGYSNEQILIERKLDMRYQGQSYELIVPYSDRFIEAFHSMHHREYGYSHPGAPIEIVNLRVRSIGKVAPPQLPVYMDGGFDPMPAYMGSRLVIFQDGEISIPFYRGERLLPGNLIAGPAVVVRDDTTILLVNGFSGSVDTSGNLCLEYILEAYKQ